MCLSIEFGMLSGDRLGAESSNESSDEDKKSQCVAWGGDAVWLLSPLHHQNVPQKLPAEIKPGIKLEQSSTARALSVTKTTRRAKYSLIRLSRAAVAE